jgi:hypothetical protein
MQTKLVEARSRLARVKVPDDVQLLISDLCSRLDVDGLRGDLVTNRAAKALVAYEGRDRVTVEDVERVVAFCLNHRSASCFCIVRLFAHCFVDHEDVERVVAFCLNHRSAASAACVVVLSRLISLRFIFGWPYQCWITCQHFGDTPISAHVYINRYECSRSFVQWW